MCGGGAHSFKLVIATSETLYDLEERINFAVFPSLQGGPHNNTIAALAVSLKEVMKLSCPSRLQERSPSISRILVVLGHVARIRGVPGAGEEELRSPRLLSAKQGLHPRVGYVAHTTNRCSQFFKWSLTRHSPTRLPGGTDNHLLLLDLRPQGVDGSRTEARQRFTHCVATQKKTYLSNDQLTTRHDTTHRP
jgi:glycine/serine hydroxymethyltransferase